TLDSVLLIFSLLLSLLYASTLFPYTTLFRSGRGPFAADLVGVNIADGRVVRTAETSFEAEIVGQRRFADQRHRDFRVQFVHVDRSEEHTSELQSRENLVCRLLLEKKKITYII